MLLCAVKVSFEKLGGRGDSPLRPLAGSSPAARLWPPFICIDKNKKTLKIYFPAKTVIQQVCNYYLADCNMFHCWRVTGESPLSQNLTFCVMNEFYNSSVTVT